MDYRLALITGIDIPIKEFQASIHQPTIKEISYIGEEDFFNALQYLSINKQNFLRDESFNKNLKSLSNFQLFCLMLDREKDSTKKSNIINVLTLLFPKYKIFLTPQSIILNQKEKNLLIDDSNFAILQKIIQEIFCINGSGGKDGFNPKGKKAQEIADKILKGRQKIFEEKGEKSVSLFSKYLSILSIGTHLSLNELSGYTVYQLYDQIERYSMYMNWDIDIRSRLAGAQNDQSPEDWMKNIH